jgi:hypothetical protein
MGIPGQESVFIPRPAGHSHPRKEMFWRKLFRTFSERGLIFSKKKVKYDGIRVFLINFDVSGNSGKLIIFLYPFLSTGEPLIKTPIGISRGLNDSNYHLHISFKKMQ